MRFVVYFIRASNIPGVKTKRLVVGLAEEVKGKGWTVVVFFQ